MPESYTGDEGDDALAAGLDVMDGTEDRRDGWRAINKTRDMIAGALTTLASGLWPWARISGKPTTFPPSAHSHSQLSYAVGISFGYNPTVGGWNTGNKMNCNGQFYQPNAFAASSGPVLAYFNSDGRLGKGTSSRRFKKSIRRVPDLGDVFAAPLREFVYKDGDGVRRIGYIAEELVGTDLERFVIRDRDGQVESIDFIPMLMAQVRALHARVQELEAR